MRPVRYKRGDYALPLLAFLAAVFFAGFLRGAGVGVGSACMAARFIRRWRIVYSSCALRAVSREWQGWHSPRPYCGSLGSSPSLTSSRLSRGQWSASVDRAMWQRTQMGSRARTW